MSQDDEIRTLERRVAADPSFEAREALRAALFRAGRDPFPREIWTPEWTEVFEKVADRPGVFMDRCRHRVGNHPADPRVGIHLCGHEAPNFKGGIAWSLESVKRIEWIRSTKYVDRTPVRFIHNKYIIPPFKIQVLDLAVVYEQHDGCTMRVSATFRDSGEGFKLARPADATHSPCPAWLVWPMGGEGRSITVSGRPVVLNPLEIMTVNISSPVQGPGYWATPCDCGHSRANHGPQGSEGLGPCFCGCQAFTTRGTCAHESCSHSSGVHVERGCMGAGTTVATDRDNGDEIVPACACPGFLGRPFQPERPPGFYVTSYLDGVITSPLCTCGHALRAHEGDGHCAADVEGPGDDRMCECRAFVRVPLCECGHVRDCHGEDENDEQNGPCIPPDDDLDSTCPCERWRPAAATPSSDEPPS